MKFLLGTKEYMTQVFDEEGNALPATVVKAGPVSVIEVKNLERDGYHSVQFGYGSKKKASKGERGHQKTVLEKVGQENPFRTVREVRSPDPINDDIGTTYDVSIFEKGDNVTVSGISKGKGFQGVVKRHGFHGGPRTHGQKHSEREAGSIGATGPQRVLKGTRMPGRMGGDRTTVKNLEVVHVDEKEGLLYIKGALPGRKGTLLEIKAN